MPRESRHAWVEEHFELDKSTSKWKCKKDDCKYATSSYHPANMRVHLRAHCIETPKKTQRANSTLNFSAVPLLSTEEKWAVMFACNGWSFNASTQCPFQAELAPTMPCRKTIQKYTTSAAEKLRTAALRRLSNVTVCYDSGTVHNRYLVFVAATRGAAVVFKCVPDSAFEDNTFSTDNISTALQNAIDLLRKHNCHVVETVCDNASNMQGAESDVGRSRCSAHVLQLAMKGTEETVHVRAGLEQMEEVGKRVSLPRVPDTRWSYKLRRLQAAAPHATSEDQRHLIQKAIEVLQPFQIATDRVQSDSATLFTSLYAWEELLAAADASVRGAVVSRFEYLIRDAYVIISYFAPTVDNVTQGAVLDPLVRGYLEKYDERAALEHDTYTRTVRRAKAPPLTFEQYDAYITTSLAPRWPCIAQVVRSLLEATPTEAAVERGFSIMKHMATDWRNRLATDTVEQLMIAQSCYSYLASLVLAKPHRSESSPMPRTPRNTPSREAVMASPTQLTDTSDAVESINVDAPAEVVDSADDELQEEAPTASITCMFQQVLDALVAKRANLPVNLRQPAPRTNTRQRADTCLLCNRPCKDHQHKPAYVTCTACKGRASVEHDELMFPLHIIPDAARKIRTHVELAMEWMCDKCCQKL